jgi:hypothetical protein
VPRGRKRGRTTTEITTGGRKRKRTRPRTTEAQEERIASVPQERAVQDEGNPYRRHYPPAPSRKPGDSGPSTRRSSRQRRRREEDSLLGDFYRRIEDSADRLFFIKYEATGTTVPQWHLVQVDIDETDPLRAKRLGEYQCNFLVAHSGDSARYTT